MLITPKEEKDIFKKNLENQTRKLKSFKIPLKKII